MVTVLALVILFAVYAFVDAGLQAVRAFGRESGSPEHSRSRRIQAVERDLKSSRLHD